MIEVDVEQEIIHEAELFAAREIRPYAQQIQEQQAIPRTLIRAMAEKGYLAASIPAEYGGMGLGPKAYGLLTEVFGKALPAVRSLLTVHTSLVSETLVRFGTPEQKSSWLPKLVKGEWIAAFGLTEPEVGSDAKSVKTEWREESDCYVLNGKRSGSRLDIWQMYLSLLPRIRDEALLFGSNASLRVYRPNLLKVSWLRERQV